VSGAAPRRRVALVIGSGSVKCAAALGLQRVLAREGIAVDMVVGCSGGSIYASFLAAGIAIGAGFAGLHVSDRVLMYRLSPPDRLGEFYGLYGMVGRFSAITGPVLWGLTTRIAGARGASILTGEALAIVMLLLMVIAGMVILRPVTDVR